MAALAQTDNKTDNTGIRRFYCPRIIIKPTKTNNVKKEKVELTEGKLQLDIIKSVNNESLRTHPSIKHNEEFVKFIEDRKKSKDLTIHNLMFDVNYFSEEIQEIFNIYGGIFDIDMDNISFNVMIYFYEIRESFDIANLSIDIFVKFYTIFTQVALIDNNNIYQKVQKYLLKLFLQNNPSVSINFNHDIPYLKTELRRYQVETISRMFNIHFEGIKVRITDNLLMKFGKGYYDGTAKKLINKDDIQQFNIHSGVIADSSGIGKTLQVITFICELIVNHNFINKLNSEEYILIIVPDDNLVRKWKYEFLKHITIPLDNLPIIIKSYHDISLDIIYSERNLNKVKMVIIDEFHKFISEYRETFNILIKSTIKYRWGVTGTPMIVEKHNMLFNIICFLTGYKFHNQTIETIPSIQENIRKCFLRLTMTSIVDQIQIPQITNIKIPLNLGQRLQVVYDTEKTRSNDKLILRKLVNRLSLMLLDQDSINSISLKEFNIFIENHYEKYCKDEEEILKQLERTLEEIKKKKFDDNIKFIREKSRIEYQISVQKEKTNKAKSAYDFYIKQSEVITRLIKKESNSGAGGEASETSDDIDLDDTCGICMLPMSEPITYFSNCGHFCHKECADGIITGSYGIITNINTIMHAKIKCPFCRSDHEVKTQLKTIRSKVEVYESPKCQYIRELITTTSDRIIIFTQFPDMIKNLISFINNINVSCATLDEYFRSTNKDDIRVLVLSSIENAEGHDLFEFNHVVIFEPFEDYTYSSAMKEQLIGRIYRFGQTKETKCTELITMNTIEAEICGNI